MNTFEETIGNFIVEFIEKPEENRFFVSARIAPKPGKPTLPLSKAQEIAAVTLAKEWYEQNRGVMVLNFHKDPLAGGMHAQVEPKGQLYRTGAVRAEAFVMTPKGLISQGKVGEIIEEKRPGNIERGNNVMVAKALWTGEWL